MSLINAIRLTPQQKEQRKTLTFILNVVKPASLLVGTLTFAVGSLFSPRVAFCFGAPIMYACYEVFMLANNSQEVLKSPLKEAKARYSRDNLIELLTKHAPVSRLVVPLVMPEKFSD
jgi:hypothetical protein